MGVPRPTMRGVSNSEKPTGDSIPPVDAFLAQPAFHAREDSPSHSSTEQQHFTAPSGLWHRFGRRLTHFLFEKESATYSSISPRTSDGNRTKIFFFNGNGRGR